MGEDIKEKLIPRAIDWFTGEALQFEELGDEMDPDEFEDEEDEDEEDEDDDDDERGSDRDVEDDSDEEVRNYSYSFFLDSRANCPIQDGTSKPKKEAAECKQN